MRSALLTAFLIALLACTSIVSADDGLSKQIEQKFGGPHKLERRATDVLSLNATETYILFRITAPSASNYVYSFTSTVTVSAYILSSTQYLAYTPTVSSDNTISPPLIYQATCSPCLRVTTCPSTTCAFTAGTWYVVIIESTPATGTVTYTDNIATATTGTGGSGGGGGSGGTATSPSPLAVSPAATTSRPPTSSTNGNINNYSRGTGLTLAAIVGIAVIGAVALF